MPHRGTATAVTPNGSVLGRALAGQTAPVSIVSGELRTVASDEVALRAASTASEWAKVHELRAGLAISDAARSNLDFARLEKKEMS